MDSPRPIEPSETDPVTGTCWTTYTYPACPPSIAVPLALTEVTDSVIRDIEPMYDAASVDPDALDTLFCPTNSPCDYDCRVTFTYHNHRVTVEAYGRITIRKLFASQDER